MTSDERRNVAEELRDLIDDDLSRDDPRSNIPLDDVERVIGLYGGFYDGGTTADCVEQLANLIDPTCKLRFDSVHQDFVCTHCGARFDSFQTFDGHGKWSDMRFCPNCGASVVSADD